MKTSIIVQSTLAALIAIGGASAARADERVVVHVPFDFIVGTMQLPAGDYVVSEDMNQSGGLLEIESADGRHSTFALSISATTKEPPRSELVFEKYEGKYFLSTVSSEDGHAREIPLTVSIMESELVKVEAAAPSAVVTP